ncbi:MAG: hypothetical protein QMD71_00620 [bacterium]|nr:hypothetical protein [bacterium]
MVILSVYVVLDTIGTNPEDWAKRSYYLKVYVIGFCVLITLFVVYTVLKEAEIQRLMRELFTEMKKEERLLTAEKFAKITTEQLQESLEVIRLAAEYLKSKLERKGEAEEIKHLEHIEKELNRANSFIDEILKLPESISEY